MNHSFAVLFGVELQHTVIEGLLLTSSRPISKDNMSVVEYPVHRQQEIKEYIITHIIGPEQRKT